jgi:hypothetical protein
MTTSDVSSLSRRIAEFWLTGIDLSRTRLPAMHTLQAAPKTVPGGF